MKRSRLDPAMSLALLFVLLSAALVVGYAPHTTSDKASADTTENPFGPLYIYATDFSPADGATGVALNANVSAALKGGDIVPSSVNARTFYLRAGASGVDVPATVTFSGTFQTVSLNPTSLLDPGTTYHATLTADIHSLADYLDMPWLNLGAGYTWSFTTDTPPQVISSIPAPGSTSVAVGQTVTVTFDKDMASPLGMSLRKMGGAAVGVALIRSTDRRTLSMKPMTELEQGTVYEVTLTDAVRSTTGVSIEPAPLKWTFTTSGQSPTGGFTDVIPGLTPYASAIAEVARRGITIGFDDGTFRPYDLVTRQQFAKMIVRTLGLPVTGSEICPFTDVATQMGDDPCYPSRYVAVCATHGITRGKTATTFDPTGVITHQQLISMIVRAGDTPSPPTSYTPAFQAGQFSTTEHYQNARKAANAGLLIGLLGIGPHYDFVAGSTRGECAQLLANLIQALEL